MPFCASAQTQITLIKQNTPSESSLFLFFQSTRLEKRIYLPLMCSCQQSRGFPTKPFPEWLLKIERNSQLKKNFHLIRRDSQFFFLSSHTKGFTVFLLRWKYRYISLPKKKSSMNIFRDLQLKCFN